MAVFRKIHVTFWSDSCISELTDKEKLFFLYLLTNERTTQIGVYEITKRQMSFDLGYSINTVSELLQKFTKLNKIAYNDATNEVSIKNWNKYNENKSAKVEALCIKERNKVKDKKLIEFQYSTDTVSILYPQEEEEETQEQEEEKEQIDFNNLLKFINISFDKNYRVINETVKRSYLARIKKDGFTKDDIRAAITNASKNQWAKDQKYNFCTPEYFSRLNSLEQWVNYEQPKELKKPELPANVGGGSMLKAL